MGANAGKVEQDKNKSNEETVNDLISQLNDFKNNSIPKIITTLKELKKHGKDDEKTSTLQEDGTTTVQQKTEELKEKREMPPSGQPAPGQPAPGQPPPGQPPPGQPPPGETRTTRGGTKKRLRKKNISINRFTR